MMATYDLGLLYKSCGFYLCEDIRPSEEEHRLPRSEEDHGSRNNTARRGQKIAIQGRTPCTEIRRPAPEEEHNPKVVCGITPLAEVSRSPFEEEHCSQKSEDHRLRNNTAHRGPKITVRGRIMPAEVQRRYPSEEEHRPLMSDEDSFFLQGKIRMW